MEETVRGEIAFKLHEAIIKNEEERRRLMARNSKLLFEMFDQEYYKDLLGDPESEWSGYLGNIEIFYPRSKVEYMRRIYKRYTLELSIDEDLWIQAPLSRLIDVLHIVDKENFESWITKAMTLLTRDWNIEVRKAKGKITEDDEHEHKNKLYEECKVCGRKTPHYEEEREDLSKPRPTLFKKK